MTTDRPEEDTHRLPAGSKTDGTWSSADGTTLAYSVDASWTALRDDEKPVADIFSVSYTVDDAGDGRPVTFVFNGGPGASSAYLHVGALGPRRVAFTERGAALPAPSRLVDNTESWLAFTDLVFVDPVGTGWSRMIERPDDAKDENGKDSAKKDDKAPDPKAFFAVNRDLDSLTEFMTRWLSSHGRWSSPLFVAGESYGGFRAAKLARLANERGLGLSGTILISPALEFALLDPSDYDVLPWLDLVPTMAVAAHHHGRSRAFGPETPTEQVQAAAEEFATGRLATQLVRGASAPPDERRAVAEELGDLIGLPADLVAGHETRVSAVRFARELLRDEGRVLGLYDATSTGRDPFPDRDGMAWPDPTLSGIERVFAGAINGLLRTELGVKTDREYHLLSMQVNKDWKIDFDQHALESQVGATDDLRYGMALNPDMRVFLCHGIYDMVTPYFSSNRIRNLLRLDEAAGRALTVEHFPGGHMFYAWEQSRLAFRRSIGEFYAEALQR
jgi:carboxypeptidase C (cathepsin A)